MIRSNKIAKEKQKKFLIFSRIIRKKKYFIRVLFANNLYNMFFHVLFVFLFKNIKKNVLFMNGVTML